jgi:hypothetical protein
MKVTTENLKNLFEAGLTIEEFTFELYFVWAGTVTLNSREFQQVLANSSIANWFNEELIKNELEYQYLIENYKRLPLEYRTELYLKCIAKIFSNFPKTLIEVAKKRELKPQTLKVEGHKIEYSINNLN